MTSFKLSTPDGLTTQPRKKKIGKTTSWFTKTAGDTSFGNVEIVPFGPAARKSVD
jgi:hypothetical protein